MNFWRHLTTGYDNKTFDTGRFIVVLIGLLVAFVVVLMLSIAVSMLVWPDRKFDFQNFGVGIGAIFTGFSTLLGAFAFYVLRDRRAELSLPEPPPATPLPPAPSP